MKIKDALIGVTRLGFDTSPLIYFIEKEPVYIARVRDIFRRMDAGDFTGWSSTVTLTEVLVVPKRLGQTVLEAEYRRFLLHGRNFTMVPISADVADRAADLRARYGIRTPDALQIASALEAKCEAFLTNDTKLNRVTDLTVILLDDLAL